MKPCFYAPGASSLVSKAASKNAAKRRNKNKNPGEKGDAPDVKTLSAPDSSHVTSGMRCSPPPIPSLDLPTSSTSPLLAVTVTGDASDLMCSVPHC